MTTGERPRARLAEVASADVLWRLQVVAAGWAIGLVATFVYQARFAGAIALTAASLVSIVGLRSLVGVVRRLDVEPGGEMTSGGAWRFFVRWTVLSAALAATIILGSREALALFLGLSVVPLALMTEAMVQVLGLGLGRDR